MQERFSYKTLKGRAVLPHCFGFFNLMAADPAFLFYPGDYLRDTQCLSEPVQVAYDRIMCEHMRNICISQAQLNFFTKRLNYDQKEELLQVLTKTANGYQIKWIAESIEKRRNYSDSRRKNRKGTKNISSSYDSHMENENEIVNGIKDKKETEKDFTKPDIDGDTIIFPLDTKPVRELWASWKKYRWEQYGARYKLMGEQSDLKRLEGMNFSAIEKTILTAIANNWKNLYPEKNGRSTSKPGTEREQRNAATIEYLKNHYGNKSG